MIDKDFDSSKAIEPRLVRRGKDLTVVSSSYATVESIKAADQLMKEKKISILSRNSKIENTINSSDLITFLKQMKS